MSAWTRLLAASSLAIGSAWAHLTHQVGGGLGVVVNNGIAVALADGAVRVAIADASRAIVVTDNPLSVVVSDQPITAKFAPGITVQITTNPIGATA